MSRDLELRESLRPLARDILPPDQERKSATIRDAFDGAGRIKASALKQSLPPSVIVWYLSGSLSTGTNVSAEVELPVPAKLTGLVMRVKTAPSGTCKARLSINGSTIVDVTVAISAYRGWVAIPAALAVRDAGDVLRIDIVNAGSAANTTVSVAHTVTD